MHQRDPVGSCLGEAVSDFHTFTIKTTMFSDGLSPVWNVSYVFPIVWYSFILLFHHVSSIFNIFLTPFCFIQELLPSSSLSTSSVAAAYDTTTELAAAPGARRPLDEQTEPRHRIFKGHGGHDVCNGTLNGLTSALWAVANCLGFESRV